jgi:hypothetical protein
MIPQDGSTLIPQSTSTVSKAGTSSSVSVANKTVSNVRNADGSVRARIHFAEKPDNPHLQKLIGETPSTAVTWDVQGLTPDAAFELQLWCVHFTN